MPPGSSLPPLHRTHRPNDALLSLLPPAWLTSGQLCAESRENAGCRVWLLLLLSMLFFPFLPYSYTLLLPFFFMIFFLVCVAFRQFEFFMFLPHRLFRCFHHRGGSFSWLCPRHAADFLFFLDFSKVVSLFSFHSSLAWFSFSCLSLLCLSSSVIRRVRSNAHAHTQAKAHKCGQTAASMYWKI